MDSSKYRIKALKNSKEHFKSFNDDSKKNNLLTIANIFLIAATGVANNVATFTGTANVITNTLLTVVLYFSLLITGVQKYYDFSQNAEKHKIISILYATLSENIEDENIPVQYIRSQYQMLRAIGPPLSTLEETPGLSMVNVVENQRDQELDFELQRMNNF